MDEQSQWLVLAYALSYNFSFSYFLLLYSRHIIYTIYRHTYRHIMQCDVTRCAICILNNVEYLDKEQSSLRYNQEITGQNLVSQAH